MSFKEVRQALGSWGIRLREDTPRDLISVIEGNKFGHICVVPGRINPKLYNDGLLSKARYVGVYRSIFKQTDNTVEIKGSGMAFWLGDEDDKGDIFETAVNLSGATFANAIRALLPPNGAVLEGTLYSVPGGGTYTGSHQWETPRKAITYVTDTYSSGNNTVEWRVNGNGTIDAGPIENLYNVVPRAVLVRRDTGRDMRLLGLRAEMSLDYDVEDLTTRVVLLAQGEGDTITTGSANASPTGFKDLFGNDLVQTRLVSESETATGNANTRAALQLKRWSAPRQAVQIRTDEFDVKGDFVVGDYIYVFDPESGFYDLGNEVYWRGQPINPIALRVTEMDWQIRPNWTVAFRKNNGEWLDLSEYYKPEGGGTTIAVGDYRRTLAGNNYEPLGFRPNLPPAGQDFTVPAAPTWSTFSTGSYQSESSDWTKAAVFASWNEPLNSDSSTITDGDHYEIRFRQSGYIGYQVRWGELSGFRWGDLSGNRWGAPITDPVETSDEWHLIFVPFEQNQVLIQELTPGVQYEFQIRAVDSAIPPNRGPWSTSQLVVASDDLFAPSTPAAPVVAASRIALQVVHSLGKSSGGTFNLEPDLAYLSVHVGGNSDFLADDSNMVGKLIANGGMIQAQIPAVGTFQIESTSAVFVKVRAVDKSGNKSYSSIGVQATAQLIDNAHISDLSVSKVTAGTILASWLISGSIKTANTGARVEISGSGIKAYNSSGSETVDISSTGAVTVTGTIKTNIADEGISVLPGSIPRIQLRPDTQAEHYTEMWSGYFGGKVNTEIGIRRISDYAANGGKVLFNEDFSILSQQPASGEEILIGLGYPVYGRINMWGKWSEFAPGTTDAITCGHLFFDTSISGWSLSYGVTMASEMCPIFSVKDNPATPYASQITLHSTTGFSVAHAANSVASSDAFYWVFRIP